MIILPEYKIRGGESETAFIIRICELMPVIGSWEEVGVIINDQLGTDYTSDAYRKPYQNYIKFANALGQDKAIENNYLSEFEKKRAELEVEKIKVADLGNRVRSMYREQSRWELMVEQIVTEIRKETKLSSPIKVLTKVSSQDRSAMAIVADPHDGAEFDIKGLFGESLNKYSPEIFEMRMWRLAEEILAIASKEKIYSWNILDLGDSIEGILRLSSLHFIKFGLQESAIHYAKFMAKWLTYLAKNITIDFYKIGGNHESLRLLTGKKDDFPSENVSGFIWEIIKAKVEENPNIVLHESHENKIILIRLFDEFNVLCTHGEEKDQTQGIKDYSNLYGLDISYLIGAHKHFSYMQEVGFNKMVLRVRSIMGINDYSTSLIKCAEAGASIFIFESQGRGLRQQYNITLNERP